MTDTNDPLDEGSPIPNPLPDSIPFSETNLSLRYNDVYQDLAPDVLRTVRWRNNAYEFECENGITLRVQVLTEQLIRFRYSLDGSWERDFSYAISPDFQPATLKVTLRENANEYIIQTEALQILVVKQGLLVRMYDAMDRLLCDEQSGFSARRTVMSGVSEVKISKKCQRKEVFYGLGDKSARGANLHGRKFENWCTDSFAFGPESDPLYRAIPFYYSLAAGVAYGIFLDNTFRTSFDFNTQNEAEVTFAAAGGEMNYYFIGGPSLTEVAQRYHQLTGTHELPPIWALGYHQCRWSYYPEQVVKTLAQQFRTEQIPCDALYLDIDYMDGYRCFTWNQQYFPDPKRMIQELKQMGFQTVVMIDPGLKEDPAYKVYQEGLEQGYLVRTADGAVAKGPVWPGFCGFPDYTKAAARRWWGQLYRELYVDQQVSGFWNDMNEPAVFYVNHKTLPDTVMHDMDGSPASHRRAHNVYGQQMARASWEGFQALIPEKRPFLLTRATFAGGQRFAAVWTGDNCATWEHLQIANIQCQRLSISGFSFCGTDIGGFSGDSDGELYTRWLQLSVFHPLMRTHSMGSHATGDAIDPAETTDSAAVPPVEPLPVFDQEPWSFGAKWTPIAKKAIELRYCLLPVIYSAMWLLKQQGLPVIRHIAFEDPDNPKAWDEERDFLFGEHLLVSPVIQARVQRQKVHLPPGIWYYFWTGQAYQGEEFVNVMADQIPFFVRAGAVLNTFPTRQHTGEPIPEDTLYVYYNLGETLSHYYEDEGEGINPEHALEVFQTFGTEFAYTINRVKKGEWSPISRKRKIYLVGFPTFARRCLVDGKDHPIKEIRLRDRTLYSLTTDYSFSQIVWHAKNGLE
jgi:alpha-glucosidase